MNIGEEEINSLKELQQRNSKHKKDIETIKPNQSEMKNTITETKTILGRINSRLNETEDAISDLKHRVVENTQLE